MENIEIFKKVQITINGRTLSDQEAYKIGAIDGINYQKENTDKNGNNTKKN